MCYGKNPPFCSIYWWVIRTYFWSYNTCKPIAFPNKSGIWGSMIWTSLSLFFHSVGFRFDLHENFLEFLNIVEIVYFILYIRSSSRPSTCVAVKHLIFFHLKFAYLSSTMNTCPWWFTSFCFCSSVSTLKSCWFNLQRGMRKLVKHPLSQRHLMPFNTT